MLHTIRVFPLAERHGPRCKGHEDADTTQRVLITGRH